MNNENNKKKPLISIITVCFNAETCIEKTIQSVIRLNQTYFEYIIIDGASKDRTVQIAHGYEGQFAERDVHYAVYSGKDGGIYDAMNKGIRLAKGKWIIYMNAGDSFHDVDSLDAAYDLLQSDDYDIVYGDEYWIEDDNTHVIKPRGADKLTEGSGILHQAAFVKTDVLRENLFDTTYKIAGDYELFLRLYRQHYRFRYQSVIIADFVYGGVSTTKAVNCLKENDEIRSKYGYIDSHNFTYRVEYLKEYCYLLIKQMVPRKLDLWMIKVKKSVLKEKRKI